MKKSWSLKVYRNVSYRIMFYFIFSWFMKIVIQLIILPVYPIQLPVGHGQNHFNSNSQKVAYMYV